MNGGTALDYCKFTQSTRYAHNLNRNGHKGGSISTCVCVFAAAEDELLGLVIDYNYT